MSMCKGFPLSAERGSKGVPRGGGPTGFLRKGAELEVRNWDHEPADIYVYWADGDGSLSEAPT